VRVVLEFTIEKQSLVGGSTNDSSLVYFSFTFFYYFSFDGIVRCGVTKGEFVLIILLSVLARLRIKQTTSGKYNSAVIVKILKSQISTCRYSVINCRKPA